MNKLFLPTSRNVLPTFQTFCPIGVQIAQLVVHCAHFKVQVRKRGVLGGLGDVLCTYKENELGWYSGQIETPSGQIETHLGYL